VKASVSVAFLVAVLGCGGEPADAPVTAPVDVAITDGGSEAEPTEATRAGPAEPEAPPAGIIGGEPILPKPVVVGGISNDAVEEAIAAHRDAIVACYEDERAKMPGMAGKVLIRFTIRGDGRVADVSTRSTSLRHEPTETCVEQVIAQATFPELASGHLAIVNYPFVF
jgi:hypothetical protein